MCEPKRQIEKTGYRPGFGSFANLPMPKDPGPAAGVARPVKQAPQPSTQGDSASGR